MAVTRIIPLHQSKGKTFAESLYERIDYGLNPAKTEKGKYVSSFACDPNTAVSEFILSKQKYKSVSGRKQKSDVIAYQVRQSFKPGEISPEEANKIGYEFAERYLKGNHAFIVATHTDKKHIHNHIYFNSTTLDCTRKFRNPIGSIRHIRRLSDLICIEHNLSIVSNPQKLNTAYNKWEGYKKCPSHRDLLKQDIDGVLTENPTSFEDFIKKMQDKGYIVTPKKRISFSHPRQRQNICLRSLGEDYSEEVIRAVISGKKIRLKSHRPQEQKTSLLIDVQKKLAEGKGKGYEQWAKVFNLKQMAKTVLYLQENVFDDYDDFCQEVETTNAHISALRDEIKTSENRMTEIAALKKHIINYLNTREVFAEYKESGYSKKYLAEHEGDILLHRASKTAFNELGIRKLPKVKELNIEYAELMKKKKQAFSEYHTLKDKHREMLIHKSNIDSILGANPRNQQKTNVKKVSKETEKN